MELVYLWVKEYKNIKEQGFNFSPRFTCEYENGTLTINKKEHVNIFPENINVTAIVGENGSGKSSILELLKNDYDLFHQGTLFFIYFDKRNNKLICLGLEQFNIELANITFPFKLKNKLIHDMQMLEKTRTIFFTHLFHYDYDLKLQFTDLHHTLVSNISTIYELADGDFLEVEKTVHDKMRKNHFSKIIRTYSTKQIQKAILAIKSDNFNLPFKAPQYLKIKQISTENILQKIINNSSNETVKKICQKLLTLYEANLASWKRKEKPLEFDDLGVKMILAFIVEKTTNISDKSIMVPFLEEIALLTDEENIQDYAKRIYEKLDKKDFTFYTEDENKRKLNAHFPQEKAYFEKVIRFLHLYKNINFYHGNGSPISHSLEEIVVEIEKNDFEFLNIYLELMDNAERFLEFSWLNLSSGEENFLYQFSRFYYLKNNRKFHYGENLKDAENLIVLFDEGESTLHPQWQKQYIHYCLDFFKNNFSEFKCHLIFTTHSPFLLSDIPKENVIFLENGNQVYPNIETFGANIHTLLSHGFFMKDGLMGEFAKEKINKAINHLNKKELTQDETDYCENIISIIGEPILKRQLQKMLDSKRLSEIENIKKQIAELQEKLEKHQHAQD